MMRMPHAGRSGQSGAVKEGPTVTIVRAINGPSVCGADYPLRVAAIGGSALFGFTDVVPPPGGVGSIPDRPRASPAQFSQAASYQSGASISAAGAIRPPTLAGGKPLRRHQ
jgi:hypothetical protein